MAIKTINISLDEKLLKEIDKAAKAQYSSRSDFIRASVLKNIPQDRVKLDEQVLSAAKKVLKTYKRDFKNLANR